MRIVVTGTKGQVARALAETAPARGHEVVLLGRPALDLEDPAGTARAIAGARPVLVVSAAAFTGVDAAESAADVAFRVNGAGAGAVAAAAAALDVPLIHLSTDYVFSGEGDRPWREDDPIGPRSVYGASKAVGEAAVREAGANHAILRTAWVYAPFGHNFVRTMLRLAATREEIRVVADQIGAPTAAHDIAAGVITVAETLVRDPTAEKRGTFHMTAAGEASWADVAEAVFAESAARGGPSARVVRITTAEYPTPARRPAYSRLDCTKLASVHGVALRDWHESVGAVVARLLANPETSS
ncbi:dTDP-4-dehydrorhamnose reductase [Salinarimonas ramus]|uniref:dTDP-4-dehydrorhamnose reductase n=1 Tax=Salinarimonas ramus TaxID=690164 RepID=A0A917VAB6_9HYPH|nr:dTDP-4-dehydrorhamnose reductase [Salinarimonas ramus]GGK55309.1 NAD(P)-dependent oxidoreductase [Salinarimonas ramus]